MKFRIDHKFRFHRPCELDEMLTDVRAGLNIQPSEMANFQRCRNFLLQHQLCDDLLQLWPENNKDIPTVQDLLVWDRFVVMDSLLKMG